MNRKIVYAALFALSFFLCSFDRTLNSFQYFLSSIAFGAIFCFIGRKFLPKSEEKPVAAPVVSEPAPAPAPPPDPAQAWKDSIGFAKYAGSLIKIDDKTQNKETNSYHYAQPDELKQCLSPRITPGVYDFQQYLSSLNINYSKLNEQDRVYTEKLCAQHLSCGYLWVGGSQRWNGQGHILTVGSARSNKGTSLVIPALIDPFLKLKSESVPSFVVLDPKGENLAVTGRYLKEAGYDVIVINPFNIPEIAKFGSHRFNIFSLFGKDSPDLDKYARMIAYALIPEIERDGKFWDTSARNIIIMYIRHLVTQDKESKNFETLWNWLRLDPLKRIDLLQEMAANKSLENVIAREAGAIVGQIASGGREQVESFYANVRAATEIFSDRDLLRSVNESDFDLSQIAHKKTALFVCITPDDLEDFKPFMRIVFGSLMRSLSTNYSTTRKVVMIMDEFIQMGPLKEFEVFSNYAAGIGAGITLWPIVQSLADLKSTYPNTWEKFLNNTIIRHYVKVTDNFTAEYLAKRLPGVERVYYSYPEPDFFKMPTERFHKERDRWQASRTARNEPLLSINDILNLDVNLVEITGVKKVALFEKQPYYRISYLKGHYDENPFRRR